MSDPLKNIRDTDGNVLHSEHVYYVNDAGGLVNYGLHSIQKRDVPDDSAAAKMAEDYPAYWRRLPEHWKAVDTYRVDELYPLPSSRLYHARKKLLVPGVRTGGKSLYDDVKEAHRTIGDWLAANKPGQKAGGQCHSAAIPTTPTCPCTRRCT